MSLHIFATIILLSLASAGAMDRMALVIANSDYEKHPLPEILAVSSPTG